MKTSLLRIFVQSRQHFRMSSVFSVVQTAPPIPVFAVNQAFLDDKHPNKVNLSIGGVHCESRLLSSSMIFNILNLRIVEL